MIITRCLIKHTNLSKSQFCPLGPVMLVVFLCFVAPVVGVRVWMPPRLWVRKLCYQVLITWFKDAAGAHLWLLWFQFLLVSLTLQCSMVIIALTLTAVFLSKCVVTDAQAAVVAAVSQDSTSCSTLLSHSMFGLTQKQAPPCCGHRR